MALVDGSFLSRSMAAASLVFAAAIMSAPFWPPSITPNFSKYAREVSLNSTLNWCASILSSACAS
ncbi:hypothetical protein D3C83_335280 [compost metagenome]